MGSVPYGKIIGRQRGIDIQQLGSGNIGFANCLRFMGLRPALAVLIGDMMKGFLPVAVASTMLPTQQVQIIALVAVLGHIFPVWLRFRGGKGIATGLGVLIVLSPLLALAAALVWISCYQLTKQNSLASLIMIAALPVGALMLAPSVLAFSFVAALIILWAHRGNIARLRAGREPILTASRAT